MDVDRFIRVTATRYLYNCTGSDGLRNVLTDCQKPYLTKHIFIIEGNIEGLYLIKHSDGRFLSVHKG